ncbi:MAG: restriction endonuclease subunit S [Nitrospiria bacterium]
MKVNRRIESNLSLWEIPRCWRWVVMGDVANIIGGGTPSTLDPKNFENGDISWITPADLSKYENKYISRGARNLSLKGFQGCGAKLMPTGTVLLSSRAPIGYLAIAGKPLCTNQGFKSFVLGPGLKVDYVYYYLKRAKNIIIGLASGTTFLELSGAKAALIPMPIAPFSEQHRIVEEIEKQFTRLDVAVEALKRVRENLKRYRASVLKAASEGRLVPTEAELAKKEGRSYEPAEVLLKRILKERRDKWEAGQLAQIKAKGKLPKDEKWKEKYIEPAQPDTANLSKLPEGWAWATSRTLSSFVTSGSRDWKGFYSNAGALFIRTQDINKNKLNLDNVAFVSLPEKVEGKRSLVQKNDLLIIITGANVGKVASVDKEIPEAYVSQSVALVKLVLPEMAKFIHMSMIAQGAGKTQLENLVYGMGRPVLSLENVQDLILPIPPLKEQDRIIAEADRRFSVLEELNTILETNLKKADRLRQAILKLAFEGKLVSQNPNDEPASVLLDRIREERIKSENEIKLKTKTKPSSKVKRQKQKVK